MLPLVLALGLAAGAPAERTRILVFDVKPTGGVNAETAENLTGLIAAILSEDTRLEVLAGPDLRSMLEIEGQKRAIGCADDTSCVAEAAGALGAKYVVIGNVGALGNVLNLNVSLFDQAKGSSVARRALQVKSLDEIPTQGRPVLKSLIAEAFGSAPDASAAPRPSSGPGVLPWLTVGAGGLALVGGVVLVVIAVLPGQQVAAEEAKFRAGDTTAFARATALQQQWFDSGLAAGLGGGGGALILAGAAAVAGGVVWAMGGGNE